MVEASPFPSAEDSDSDDVRWALETASAMWGQGDSKEALRWLKKAADTASEEGDDMRSLTLAKAAAELRGTLEREGHDVTTQAPPAVAAGGPGGSAPPASALPLGSAPPMPSSPPSPASAPPPASVPPTAQQLIVPSSGPESGDESRPTLVHPRSKFIPAPKNDSLEPDDDEEQPPPSSVRPSAPAPPSSRGSSPRAARRLPPARKSTPARRPASTHHAVRVSVQPVDNQPGAFVARILSAGERPAQGAIEAMLVALDPKATLD